MRTKSCLLFLSFEKLQHFVQNSYCECLMRGRTDGIQCIGDGSMRLTAFQIIKQYIHMYIINVRLRCCFTHKAEENV